MILYTFQEMQHMAAGIADIFDQLGAFTVRKYENGETSIHLGSMPVKNQVCYVLRSLLPSGDNITETLMLISLLKKEGAKKVNLISPYLAYSRQDKEKPFESLGIRWLGNTLKAAGCDAVITFDIHSSRDFDFFAIPIISFASYPLFAEIIRERALLDATLVAPDDGAILRAENLASMLGLAGTIVYFNKQRIDEGFVQEGPFGRVGKRAIIVDDILDTGKTVLSTAQRLQKEGVEEIYVVVTHALFSGNKWKMMFDFGVKNVFCTPTNPGVFDIDDNRVVIIPMIHALRERLKEFFEQPVLQ